jgi:hypothetical protein
MTLFRRRYGSTPLHLLAHLAAFALAAYALAQVINGGAWVNFVAWFVGAALLHDIVFLPLYSALDRIAHGGARRLHMSAPAFVRDADVPPVNHIRAPALISALLLLVYFPLILGAAEPAYLRATGHHLSGYLRDWLLITAALFLGSAVVYAVRIRRRS